MKTIKHLTIYFFLSFALFCSCEKDKEEPANHFVHNGKTHNLDKGFIRGFGQNPNGSYDFDLYFVSSTIQYSSSKDYFNGIGDFLYLDINTSSANGLVNGTYNFASERGAFTLYYGEVAIDFDLGYGESGNITDILGGKVDVEVVGNETILDFDLTTKSNTKVTGRYKGVLILM